MEETIFPPSPSWFLSDIIAAREDGSVSYGSKNNIVILKSSQIKNPEMSIIQNAHTLKITAVAFSPSNCCESVQNTIVSCSEDGFVKLWKIDTLTATIGHKSHWEQKKDIGKIVSLNWSVANPCYVLSAAENNSLVLWDVLSNSTIKFSFQKNLGMTVISCCPYNEKIVAVGGKTGQIYIISLTGSGDILYKLRGHDNKIHSLSWCPVPYNVFRVDEICEEFLLASACQNKEIFIWRAGSDGKCEAKFQFPTHCLSKKDSQYCGKVGNTFSYAALLWFEPYKIYSSSNFGELIYFDIKSYVIEKDLNGTNKGQKLNKQSLNSIKMGHNFHSKGLFAIAASQVKPEILLYENIQIKSELKFINQLNFKVTEKFESGNEVDFKWEAITPENSSLLWTAGQDRKLIGCKLKASKLEIVCSYNTLNGFVYCAVVSPHDPYKIAIGVGDGMIRLWNLTDYGDVKIYWQKIKDRVMSLAWHPMKDGLLAYGTSEGRVGLIDTNSSKLPNVFKPSHPHPIYSMSWGLPFTLEGAKDLTSKSEFDLYAIGDNTLSLYSPSKLSADPLNLSEIIPFPCKKQTDVCWKPDYSLMAVGNDDGSICLIEPVYFKIVYTLQVYKKLIQAIAWHPSSTSLDSGVSPFNGYFTSGSTDNSFEIRVFNCRNEEKEVKVEQVATLKGHYGHISSVSWSPHISGRLISTSADLSVQIWDVVSQTALVNFTGSGMPLFSLFSPIDPDFILTGCRSDVLHVWKVSAQTKVCPSSCAKTKKQKKEKMIQMCTAKENMAGDVKISENGKETETLAVAETVESTKSSKEVKMFSKSWKGDANDAIKACYFLLKNDEKTNSEGEYSLLFLSNDFKELVLAEEEALKKSNNRTEFYELALWCGNIKEVLEEKIKSGQLNDFLVSLAPVISPRVWQEACLSYSKTLCEKKMYRKAASYLIVCHKVYEAINLLMNANLYLEALCIARSRLPESDPVLKSIIREYAQWFFKNGSFLKACECYIYLEDYLEVARICSKKSQPEYLSLAALAARKCGSDLEHLEATNAIFKCFETDNFELALRICNDHSNLRHLDLLFFIYHTIYQLESGKLELKQDILSHVRQSVNVEDVVYPSFLPTLFHKYSFYKNRRQVLSVVTQELCFAVCSRDTEDIFTHLIKALSTCYRYLQNPVGEAQLLFQLCTWLSPQGFLTGNEFFSLKNNHLSAKAKSLRAFLCAAIIKHVDDNQKADDIVKYLDILNELKEDLLDANSYAYYKSLIEIEICEKRLLKNRSKLSRKALTNERNSDGPAGIVLNSHSPKPDVINGEDNAENYFLECDGQNGKPLKNLRNLKNEKDEGGNLKIISKEELEGDIVEEQTVSAGQESLEIENENNVQDEINRDLELLRSLKYETENFEKIRISSPNPLPLYFILGKLCKSVPESETVKIFQEDLEKKWKEFN